MLGALSDRAMSRRSVLLISFLGSALSYGTIGLSSSLNMLLMGRVVVGLVKQVRASDRCSAVVPQHKCVCVCLCLYPNTWSCGTARLHVLRALSKPGALPWPCQLSALVSSPSICFFRGVL